MRFIIHSRSNICLWQIGLNRFRMKPASLENAVIKRLWIISGAKSVSEVPNTSGNSVVDVLSKGERDRSSLETRLSPHGGAGRTNTFPVYNLELGKRERETFARRGVSEIFRQ